MFSTEPLWKKVRVYATVPLKVTEAKPASEICGGAGTLNFEFENLDSCSVSGSLKGAMNLSCAYSEGNAEGGRLSRLTAAIDGLSVKFNDLANEGKAWYWEVRGINTLNHVNSASWSHWYMPSGSVGQKCAYELNSGAVPDPYSTWGLTVIAYPP